MYTALQEDGRGRRRTVADAFEVVQQTLGIGEVARAQIMLGPFPLPWGGSTAAVAVLFPDLDCYVSLPASASFSARTDTGSQRREFDIALLGGAEACSDGSVLLIDGSRLRAVEVMPTHLRTPSALDNRILRHVIALTKSYWYRNMREELPEHLRHGVPDFYMLDYGRVSAIDPPPLKVVRAYIEAHDPELQVSNQTIASALATWGVRVPRRRPRTVSQRAAARATI
jgi:hypothetical protein